MIIDSIKDASFMMILLDTYQVNPKRPYQVNPQRPSSYHCLKIAQRPSSFVVVVAWLKTSYFLTLERLYFSLLMIEEEPYLSSLDYPQTPFEEVPFIRLMIFWCFEHSTNQKLDRTKKKVRFQQLMPKHQNIYLTVCYIPQSQPKLFFRHHLWLFWLHSK